MKKLIYSLLIIGLVGISAKLAAFSGPIPVVVDQGQHSRHGAEATVYGTQTEATNLMFGAHPPAPGVDQNFHTIEVNVEGVEEPIKIQDIVATPGMLPPGEGETLAEMILNVPVRAGYLGRDPSSGAVTPAMNPAQAFCPDSPEVDFVTSFPFHEELEFECNALSNYNRSNVQLELADIKNVADNAEYDRIGGTALVPGVVGSAEQSKYPGANPATVSSHNFPFTWIWGLNRLTRPYSAVLSYGLSYFDNALVSAAYDPVFLNYANARSTVIVEGNPADISTWATYDQTNIDLLHFPRVSLFLSSHISPLIAYFPQAGAVKLAGYTSWQFGDLDLTNLPRSLRRSLIGDPPDDPGFIWKFLMGMNINPIDVQSFPATASGPARLAVINQATLGSLDQCVRGNRGVCLEFVDGTASWREALGTNPGNTIDGFRPLASSSGETAAYYLPHDVVSYVTFWEIDQETSRVSANINKRWNPVAFSLIGPGAYSSAILVEQPSPDETMSEADREKQTDRFLLVASSEVAPDNSYYVYKIAPKVLGTNENLLYFDPAPGESAEPNVGQKLPGIVGQPFRVMPPYPGFAPYELKTADINRDGCDDMFLTWRGADILPAKTDERFENDYEQAVHFKNSSASTAEAANDEMFSNCFTAHLAIKAPGGSCVFQPSSRYIQHYCDSYLGDGSPASRPRAQIASITIGNFNGNDLLDVVAGNLIPMQVPGNNEYAAYGFLFNDISIVPESSPGFFSPDTADDFVRIGYKTTTEAPAGSGSEYLLAIARNGSDVTRRAGVAKLSVDENGNIGAISGLPLMMPKMGCPDWTNPNNAEVQSPIESYLAIHYNRTNIDPAGGGMNAARDSAGNIMPMRCGVTEPVVYDCPAIPLDGEWWVLHECCQDCSDVMRSGDFYECWNYCDPNEYPMRLLCAPEYAGDPVLRARCRMFQNMCAGLEPCLGDGSGDCLDPLRGTGEFNCCGVLDDARVARDCSDLNIFDDDPPTMLDNCLEVYNDYCYSEYETYQTFCDLMRPCAGDGASLGLPNERSQHYACNTDRIYDSKAAFIAELKNLIPAALQVKETAPSIGDLRAKPGVAATKVEQLNKITPIPIILEQEIKKSLMSSKEMTEQKANEIIKSLRQVMLENENTLPVMLIQPFLKLFVNTQTEEQSAKQPAAKQEPELKLKQKTSWLDKLTGLLVNDAYGFEVPGLETNTRFSRGKAMPGLREMTVVLKGDFPTPDEPTVPPPVDPTGTCPSCPPEGCPCPCACMPGEGSPCSVSDAVEVVSRCTGWSSPATKALGMDMNKQIRDAIREGGGEPLDNDFFCESEATWKVWITVPEAANITKAASTGDFTGQVANSLLVQRGGNVLVDYKKQDKLPSKTNIISQPMIILPPLVPADFAAMATFITPELDLSLATQAAEVSLGSVDTSLSSNLAAAVPVPADLVTSVDLYDTGVMSFNNVLRWEREAAPTQGKAADSTIGSAVHLVEIDTPPTLCSWTASCPDTEATLPENSLADLDFEKVLDYMRDHGRLCQKGVCAPEFFEQWPPYLRLNFALVQSKTTGVQAVPFAGIAGITFKGKGGGGCGCLISGEKVSQVSMIAMLLMVGMLGGGYLLVRVRNKRK
ncbi:MAG: hypothetical protein ABH859_00820 [Pseudomonadota bacterium]